jgi:formylglycine-generating enzyme required for sulfatase activity
MDSVKNAIDMTFAWIPAGSFVMGSRLSQNEIARRYGGKSTELRYEKPFHTVQIKMPFYIQTTPVTQRQWKKIMRTHELNSAWVGEDLPVENVSWYDAHDFIKRLNEIERVDQYRLPTESEWEYACRAGSNEEFFFGDDASLLERFAWYEGNSNARTHPVGEKAPNGFGLYDMCGNVCEWVEDDWNASYKEAPADGSARIDVPRASVRVLRGGSWRSLARLCRSAARDGFCLKNTIAVWAFESPNRFHKSPARPDGCSESGWKRMHSPVNALLGKGLRHENTPAVFPEM